MRLGVLVSGRGSNLEAVLEAVADGRLPGCQPVLVISNRPGVRALEVAARDGVPTMVLRRTDFAGDADARDRAIGQALTAASVRLALLAGYDQLLWPGFFEAYRGRAINIHPSLLPAHGGPGMMGLAVHRSVLATSETVTGVTIHEVTRALDSGPPIAQRRVAIRPGEGAEELAARVLEIEHALLVETLADLTGGPVPGASSARMAASPPPRRSSEDH